MPKIDQWKKESQHLSSLLGLGLSLLCLILFGADGFLIPAMLLILALLSLLRNTLEKGEQTP